MNKKRSYPYKKDTGIIPKLGITEARRDELAKRDWAHAPKPVDHPDLWTTQECKDKRFSGYRINAISHYCELWILGEICAKEHMDVVQANPGVLGTMMEKVALTNGTVVMADMPDAKGTVFTDTKDPIKQ